MNSVTDCLYWTYSVRTFRLHYGTVQKDYNIKPCGLYTTLTYVEIRMADQVRNKKEAKLFKIEHDKLGLFMLRRESREGPERSQTERVIMRAAQSKNIRGGNRSHKTGWYQPTSNGKTREAGIELTEHATVRREIRISLYDAWPRGERKA
jgi:hypothetical protein